MNTEENHSGVTLDSFVDPAKLVADLALNEVDLNDAFLNQAGLYAYYGVLAARAAAQAASTKLLRDVTEAKVSQEVRSRALDDKEKVTEAVISERVTLDPRTKAVNKAYIRATEIEGELKSAAEAMRQRRDMVIQLGASSREEAKGTARMSLNTGVTDRASELKSRLAKKV